MTKPVDAEMNALGEYFDKHIDDKSEWGEALPSPIDALAAARRHLAAKGR